MLFLRNLLEFIYRQKGFVHLIKCRHSRSWNSFIYFYLISRSILFHCVSESCKFQIQNHLFQIRFCSYESFFEYGLLLSIAMPSAMSRVNPQDKEEDEEVNVWNPTLTSCKGVCTGHAWCLYNLLCCPLVLVYKSITIYCCTCLAVMMNRLSAKLFRIICCCCASEYNDSSFPPTEDSLGVIEDFDEKSNIFKCPHLQFPRAHNSKSRAQQKQFFCGGLERSWVSVCSECGAAPLRKMWRRHRMATNGSQA